jgi:hypothetical protein
VIGISLLAKIRSHLVDDVRDCWKWASVHWAIIVGGVTTYFAEPSNWSTVASTFYSIPPEYRMFVPPAFGFLVAVVPVLLRVWNQGKKNG